MDKIVTLMMALLWFFSIIGILLITFTNFKFVDLNILIGILVLFTLLNTLFAKKSS